MDVETTLQAAPELTSRVAKREATRKRIIETGIAAFAARGFEGTSLPLVAATAEVQVSLIVYYFQSKLGLWKACVDTIYHQVNAHLDAQQPAIDAADGADYFRLAIRAHIMAAAAFPAFHRVLFQESMQNTDRLEWLISTHQRTMSDRILQIVRRAQTAGLLPADADPMHLKFVTSGMLTLPITLAPEYALLSGDDPLTAAFLERHIAMCLSLFGHR